MVTIQVPVAPHVKKFLVSRYGEKFTLTLTDPLGKYIHSILTKKVNSIQDIISDFNTETYPIVISGSKIKTEGCVINKTSIYLVSQLCDNFFRELVYSYTLIYSQNHPGKYTEAIREVLRAYQVTEEDISLDTLYRDFKRKRENIPFANINKGRIPLSKS